jgi:hypothetical protein
MLIGFGDDTGVFLVLDEFFLSQYFIDCNPRTSALTFINCIIFANTLQLLISYCFNEPWCLKTVSLHAGG